MASHPTPTWPDYPAVSETTGRSPAHDRVREVGHGARQGSSAWGPGTILLGRYELIGVIGRGGMGNVLRAFDRREGREVAIKVLHSAYARDEKACERFRREQRYLAQLDHAAAVRIYDAGMLETRQPYLVMEYVTGQSLARWISSGALTAEDACSISLQIAGCLVQAHELGIVHRDLKPENILVDGESGDLKVKVIDFGIALDATSSRLTLDGQVFGTPHYMAPEQCEGRKPDPRSDLYALGCLLFEMLTGTPPFVRTTAIEIMQAHLHARVQYPNALPAALRTVLTCTLEKQPRHRVQNARELRALLLSAASSSRARVRLSDTSLSRAKQPASLWTRPTSAAVGWDIEPVSHDTGNLLTRTAARLIAAARSFAAR